MTATEQQNANAWPQISAIITCFNEQERIADCIKSVDWCDEVIVVDSYSTDDTPRIAREHAKTRFHQHTYYGGAAQKNWAIELARYEWILILDADECCTPALREEMRSLLASSPEADAFTISRRVYFAGHRIRFSGWQHDRVIRLFRKGSGYYQNRRVHARLFTIGPAPLLKNALDHYMVDSIDEFANKITRYAYWGAAQSWLDSRSTSLLKIICNPIYRFIRTYFLQLGILDGVRGLIFCSLQAYGSFLKQTMLWGFKLTNMRGTPPQLPEFEEDPTVWQGLERLERQKDGGSHRTVTPVETNSNR
jgi:glycosyltransferase involved in cell wall biosynthesis